jgi:hypothetical protein
MSAKSTRLFMLCLFLLAALFAGNGFSAYIEGIDTTDINGYGLDSAFRINNNGNCQVVGQVVSYLCKEAAGYFNYAFEDIKKAPNMSYRAGYVNPVDSIHSFVIKKSKDSTYSKVQLLKHLSGNQYVYRYGTNTTPNNIMLIDSNYDRSILYKPNNLSNLPCYLCRSNSTLLESPLPNNNHFLGYTFYVSRNGEAIDTTIPINPAQWDPFTFFSSAATDSGNFLPYRNGQKYYFNVVADYMEGKSDFLTGWTSYLFTAIDIKNKSIDKNLFQNKIVFKKTTNGFFISLLPIFKDFNSLSFGIYSMTGKQLANFSIIENSSGFWNTSERNFAPGLYLLRVALPDKRVISQKIMFSK